MVHDLGYRTRLFHSRKMPWGFGWGHLYLVVPLSSTGQLTEKPRNVWANVVMARSQGIK
jgi:hypothetical protein